MKKIFACFCVLFHLPLSWRSLKTNKKKNRLSNRELIPSNMNSHF